MTAHVEQTRRVARLDTGGTAYEIATLVTDAGTLPTRNLFVVKVVGAGDAKTDVLARIATPMDLRRIEASAFVRVDSGSLVYFDDSTFARVASIAELSTMPQDRAEAVRLGLPEYLTASVTLSYPDQVTADAAYRQLLARLSTLVTDWATFTGTFETTPTQGYDLPVLPQSVEDDRRAVYATAHDARKAAEVALDAAQRAFDACHTDCATDRALHALLTADVARLEKAETRASGIAETGSTNVRDFALRTGAYASDPDSWHAILVDKRAALATAQLAVLACATACDALQTTRDVAQGALAAAADAERQALAGVREVCPTFVPTE